jgi:ATP-dependent DNA helicase RecG
VTDVKAALRSVFAGRRATDVESATLDFKQEARTAKDSEQDLAKAAICFANATGGTIVVGVDDKRSGARALIGCDLDPARLRARIYELTRPGVLVTCRELLYEGVRLVVVEVPEGVEIHSDTKGATRWRVETQCLPMSTGDQMLTRERRGIGDFTAAVSERNPNDIRPEAMQAARRALTERGDPESAELFRLSDMDLLRALGVVNSDGRLLRGGELLLCDPPPNTYSLIYQHRPTPGGEATLVERLRGPLILVFEQAVALAWSRRNVTPVNLPGGRQIEIPDFPRPAVREVVANGLLHRMYQLREPVSVEHSPTSFVVESPGPLVAGVDEANILTHPSKPRNRCLFEAARMLSLAEETGRGVDRMYRELILAGHLPPQISQRHDATRVVFASGTPRAQVVTFLRRLPEFERVDVDTLLLIVTMLRSRTITAKKLAETIQKSEVEAEAVLSRHAGGPTAVLEVTRETARMRLHTYRLSSNALQTLGTAVEYQRTTPRQAEQKIVAHVAEYGRITNRTVRNLLDIDMQMASILLRSLRDSGLLVRTSEQRRGRSVEYGPGPVFPDHSS